MLQRYLDCKTLRLPMTGNRYYLFDFNKLMDSYTGFEVPIKTIGAESFVDIDFGTGPVLLKLGVAVALCSKNSQIPFYLWNKLDVLHVNRDKCNNHPGNLVWRFPTDGLVDENGFAFIPGFTRYRINKSGEVYSTWKRGTISSYVDSMGYEMFGITPDLGKRTILGKHRLLALAFLSYPENVDKLDVNHIDGNKKNSVLSNLEWASRKRNCDHAYSTGLRTDNIEVQVRNVFTGEVFNHYSIEDCARKHNIDGETIRLRLTTDGGKLYPPGFQFKTKDSQSSWATYEDPTRSMIDSRLPKQVLTRHKDSAEIITHKDFGTAMKAIGVKDGCGHYYFKDKYGINKINDYEVWYQDFKQSTLSVYSEMSA